MTALTGTLIGDAVRQAQIDVLLEMGVLRPREVTGPSVGTGVFGGYLYMSGSAMRLFGVRMPGMSPRDADTQSIGEVTDLRPYRPRPAERLALRRSRAGLSCRSDATLVRASWSFGASVRRAGRCGPPWLRTSAGFARA